MNVGRRLKELREERSLSMYRLSQLSGVTQSYISRIESGDRMPTVDVLEKLCAGLNISIPEFFRAESHELDSKSDPLLSRLKELSPQQRQAILQLIDAFKE